MTRPHLVAPSERAALRDLELLARTTVEGLRQGLHKSPFHGYNAEFSQYRHYRPGDDLKYVDWKAFARSDRLYSRQFRETTNLGALLVVDVSRSMAFPFDSLRSLRAGPVSKTKFALATAVAAVLGTLIIDQGDAAGLLGLHDSSPRGATYLPGRSGRHHLHLLLAALARLEATGTAPIGTALTRAASLLRRRGVVVVLSDFYDETAALTEVRRIARMGHDVIVVHTLAREELTLPPGGAVEFEDLETGARVVADSDAARRRYEEGVQDFLVSVERSVQRDGLDYVRLFTHEPIEPALRRFLISRRGAA